MFSFAGRGKIMDEERGKPKRTLIIALLLILGGSFLAAWIQTGAGTATIREVRFYGSYDGYRALFFMDSGCTYSCPELKNFAMSVGKHTEVPANFGAPNGAEIPNMPAPL
jgi:hypothetical protein